MYVCMKFANIIQGKLVEDYNDCDGLVGWSCTKVKLNDNWKVILEII